ncbi:MAG: DNA-binding response regulator [Arcobacter sp.]|jgi:DNA-binding NtrC family response regulator|uniref:Response regulator receiver domain-containing protein n=1 Tax=Arcobacter defluvii TaxID=873191 RepID=A0AAE7E5E7_9BACT|nr:MULTISPECIES: response regulator [Arcobacter]MDY3200271.1 DNA-binding response regulator [Arcobacter sp.]QKF76267.1 response regulator receiver domain-containing protein [Arcobacter defluvii]RXI30949.1 response regulator [Arcobacter defluvii]BAK72079.1 two-component response regulator [Arcobacter sp. L]
MNILIIENEIYLAQKVVSRLLDDGHSCDYIESPNIDNLTKDYDTILLSTSLPSSLCKNIIKRYSETSIILLLVSYISDETVTNPIKDGAKDYIMKPFIMDELVRKIYHYKECRSIRRELQTLRDYFNFTMSDIDTSEILLPPSFPTLIETNSQKCADKLVFELARKMDLPICFISLTSSNWQKQMNAIQGKTIIYLTDYHTLKKNMKEQINKLIEDKNCIVSTLEPEEEFPHRKIEFNNEKILLGNSNIMTINDYVKMMVISYQNKYPDTELSKKLGISRKSLWEKRKKLDIEKKK